MVNTPPFFLIISLVGLLMIALILLTKVIIEEIRKHSNDQLILFSILGVTTIFLIPFILALIQNL